MDQVYKSLRYYYWLFKEFLNKYLIVIFLSMFASMLVILSFLTISPYIISMISTHAIRKGIVGSYQITQLPDEVQKLISNGLFSYDEKGYLVPILVDSYTVSKDGLEYRFKLKKNLTFDNTQLFESKDINYTFRDDISIKYPNANEIVFTLHLKKKTEKPLAIFPTLLTKPILIDNTIGIGGLYRIQRIVQKYNTISELYLTPNKKELQPYIYKIYQSESDMITAYKLGNIDTMTVTKKPTADSFKNWKNTKVSAVIDNSSLVTLLFNHNNPILKEKDARLTIESIINTLSFSEDGIESTSPISVTSWAYRSDLKKHIITQDQALKQFQKYSDSSKEASLVLSAPYEYLDLADKISDMLSKINIKTIIKVLSYNNTGSSNDLTLVLLKIPKDPDQNYYWHSLQPLATTVTHYQNLRVDKYLEDARNTANYKERREIYWDFQKTIHDDVAAAFLYFPYVYNIERK